MVVVNQKIRKKVGFVDDGRDYPLYTRYHRNTVQRDLIDQGYFVDVETNAVVKPGYDETATHYAAEDLPKPVEHIEAARADLEKFGYCLIADALTPAQLETYRDRLDTQAAGERRANVGSYTAPGADGIPANQFLLALVNKGECFADAVELHPRSVERATMLDTLLTEVLGREFICNSAAAALAGPGGAPQALHCGQSMIPKPWPPWPYECFLGFLLDDFNADNGGTLVIPGSHQILSDAGTDPIPELPPTTNVTAPAGSALIMDGRLVHGTGSNRTEALRRLLILTFHKPFIRQQEQWPLTLRPEVYQRASDKLKQRLGFTAWHGGLGGFEGHGEGSTAPLREDYRAVGALDASGEPLASDPEDGDYYLHRSKVGRYNAKQLEQMRAADKLITRD
ncbi:MAG: phytanoyl-CoA dioxygenase family protein [Pseudomonadota bacterium]